MKEINKHDIIYVLEKKAIKVLGNDLCIQLDKGLTYIDVPVAANSIMWYALRHIKRK